ncbi:hypothetical protein BJ875DRAFT_457431 [Amylocarpus encephaloides]|uniref:Uncharacterized protein n=1 Tax=Amylocarpus encephaloides TaxID=45428 RepID=A0A9P7YN32_9HELO|nr:hypothetical protein BJ875DRAFT_457431 [Amylocarpus encephaloides]
MVNFSPNRKPPLSMQPDSVALLAALLPTLVIISALSCLPIYLFTQLRKSLSRPLTLEKQPPTGGEEDPWDTIVGEPSNGLRSFVGHLITDDFSQAGNFDEETNLLFLHEISCWTEDFIKTNNIPDPIFNDAEVSQHLAVLGYKAMPAASFLRLLRNHKTRRAILSHLVTDVLLRWTSLDGDPKDSLLPFTAQQHKDLKAYFEALDGVKVTSQLPYISPQSTLNSLSQFHQLLKSSSQSYPSTSREKKIGLPQTSTNSSTY